MPNVEKLSIALTPEMATLVRDAVKSGEYASSSEIIREALRDWKYKRFIQSQNIYAIGNLYRETGHFFIDLERIILSIVYIE